MPVQVSQREAILAGPHREGGCPELQVAHAGVINHQPSSTQCSAEHDAQSMW